MPLKGEVNLALTKICVIEIEINYTDTKNMGTKLYKNINIDTKKRKEIEFHGLNLQCSK